MEYFSLVPIINLIVNLRNYLWRAFIDDLRPFGGAAAQSNRRCFPINGSAADSSTVLDGGGISAPGRILRVERTIGADLISLIEEEDEGIQVDLYMLCGGPSSPLPRSDLLLLDAFVCRLFGLISVPG